jgi:hypothetical protein
MTAVMKGNEKSVTSVKEEHWVAARTQGIEL